VDVPDSGAARLSIFYPCFRTARFTPAGNFHPLSAVYFRKVWKKSMIQTLRANIDPDAPNACHVRSVRYAGAVWLVHTAMA